MNNDLLFQYCQKIVIFDKDLSKVFLARRKGEADYDGVFSFIGGKLEKTDQDFTAGLRREKNEEIGQSARIKIWPSVSYNVLYRKRDGNSMVLPHHLAIYTGGEIKLNEEYSEGMWVRLEDLAGFEPKIETVSETVLWAKSIYPLIKSEESVII